MPKKLFVCCNRKKKKSGWSFFFFFFLLGFFFFFFFFVLLLSEPVNRLAFFLLVLVLLFWYTLGIFAHIFGKNWQNHGSVGGIMIFFFWFWPKKNCWVSRFSRIGQVTANKQFLRPNEKIIQRCQFSGNFLISRSKFPHFYLFLARFWGVFAQILMLEGGGGGVIFQYWHLNTGVGVFWRMYPSSEAWWVWVFETESLLFGNMFLQNFGKVRILS